MTLFCEGFSDSTSVKYVSQYHPPPPQLFDILYHIQIYIYMYDMYFCQLKEEDIPKWDP